MIKVQGSGPPQADIVIVGEAPGSEEELEGKPFVGASGRLLNTLLREAGINPANCYFTNVCKYRPPGNKIDAWITPKKGIGTKNEWELRDGYYHNELIAEGLDELPQEISDRNPRIIIGVGNLALWALSGMWGITDWRGSELQWFDPLSHRDIPFVPTLPPASVLRSWETRPFIAHDLKQRVSRRLKLGFPGEPKWDFNYAPTFEQAITFINSLAGDVAVDVETSRGQIVCVGLATSPTRAMCIPFIHDNYGAYWSGLDRNCILAALKSKLTQDANVHVVGQNFNYDASYFHDNFAFLPRVAFDTLIAQSVLFPGMPRGLGFLSSMYADWHRYWKEDARDWNNLRDFAGLFRYNCLDVCRTWEIAQAQRKLSEASKLQEQFEERIRYNHSVFDMMDRGVIRDASETARLDAEIEEALQERKLIIREAAGAPINPTSPKQVSTFLYNGLGLRKPARRGKEAGGTGDEEIKQLIAWHPEHKAMLTAILEHRSLASVRANFLRAQLDPDGRLRSSFMATGTETFRLTSSKNNFGRGTNLLNLSGSGTTHSGNKVPNFRSAIVPPAGYTVFDCDLERADLQVVVWEADDADLKAKLREGADIHRENAKDLFGTTSPSDEQREQAKTFVHLTDYGGSARTAAIKCRCTVHEADMAQRRWFAAHPGIKRWHKRVQAALESSRTVYNAFGYRMVFFERVEGLLPEALAWIPQSTIAILASKIHMAMEAAAPVEIFLQMYDSVAGIYRTADEHLILPKLNEARKIIVPYPDPLIIPMGIATSTTSWGDCKEKCNKRDWREFELEAA